MHLKKLNLEKLLLPFILIYDSSELNEECPYGDGQSSKKIVNVLLSCEGI